MKKITTLILSIFLMLVLVSCSKSNVANYKFKDYKNEATYEEVKTKVDDFIREHEDVDFTYTLNKVLKTKNENFSNNELLFSSESENFIKVDFEIDLDNKICNQKYTEEFNAKTNDININKTYERKGTIKKDETVQEKNGDNYFINNLSKVYSDKHLIDVDYAYYGSLKVLLSRNAKCYIDGDVITVLYEDETPYEKTINNYQCTLKKDSYELHTEVTYIRTMKDDDGSLRFKRESNYKEHYKFNYKNITLKEKNISKYKKMEELI